MTSNASNESNASNRCCCICLEEETDPFKNVLISYEHCGKYYIHNKCLNKWKYNECIICRKKIYNFYEEDQDILYLRESNTTETQINQYNNNNQTYNIESNHDNFSTLRTGVIISYMFLRNNYIKIFKGCTFIVVCIVGMHYFIKFGNEFGNEYGNYNEEK